MTDNIDVGDIIEEYLEKNGYHGLYTEFGECACLIKDIGACENISLDCIPGWMSPCDCGEHDFHITSVKRELDTKKSIVKEKKEKPMSVMRESMELMTTGCQVLINQQSESIVLSVSFWDSDSTRIHRRFDFDAEQADKLSEFLARLALKAREQAKENERIDTEEEEATRHM